MSGFYQNIDSWLRNGKMMQTQGGYVLIETGSDEANIRLPKCKRHHFSKFLQRCLRNTLGRLLKLLMIENRPFDSR